MRCYRCFCSVLVLSISALLWSQTPETVLAINNYHYYKGQAASVKSQEKEVAMQSLRKALFELPIHPKAKVKLSLGEVQSLLKSDGTFSDLDDSRVGTPDDGNQADSGGTITEAFNRIWFISEAFKNGSLNMKKEKNIWMNCQKAIVHYGNIEIARPNNWSRFHASCFAIPTAAVHIYFCCLPQMDQAEQGKSKDKLLKSACDMLKTIALQAWTQPFRDDETDKNVVQLERFRKHTWWVGGNALGYRPLLPVAIMLRSIPMIDLLTDISHKCIDVTSQSTYDVSFWNEGFTADGAGWGHGKQCLIWGYPIDGTVGALGILKQLKGTPWDCKLSKENVQALMSYCRGGNYYYYKGYKIPCLDRNSMAYVPQPYAIPYQKMLGMLIENWKSSFSPSECEELELLYKETEKNEIRMDGYESYNGTRWFFNNDDLIKKTPDYHIMVNMASIRCDGIESADSFADSYNFYTTDGTTMFQKAGNEYSSIFGGFDVTAMPGVTAREGMERLVSVTNWRGYTSKHNFAAGATAGGENAVAGFIFEKMNGSDREGVNDPGNSLGHNEVLYGVKAYKSYFMLGDYMVALGAGVTNLQPEQPGDIRTTIEQAAHTDSVYICSGKGIDWVIQQGKFAYSVLPEYKDKMRYVCETKKTDWVKMNKANQTKKNLPEYVDIFRMWINHGQTPVNDTYGYVVYSGKQQPAYTYPFEVLSNDTTLQAIMSKDRTVLESVFYDKQKTLVGKDFTLSVSAPCAVLVEKMGTKYRITVTDALMDKNCKSILVTLNGKLIDFPMPQGLLCGKPVTLYI